MTSYLTPHPLRSRPRARGPGHLLCVSLLVIATAFAAARVRAATDSTITAFSPSSDSAAARPALPIEGRALWIVRSSMTTPASIDSAIARAQQVHATDIL